MFKLLRLASLICCAFVIASFFLFAVAQTSHASRAQANAVFTGVTETGAAKTTPVSQESQPRRLIDQVAQQLNAPFTGIVSSGNHWAERLVPTVFSLLVYGFGVGFLVRWAAVRPSRAYV